MRAVRMMCPPDVMCALRVKKRNTSHHFAAPPQNITVSEASNIISAQAETSLNIHGPNDVFRPRNVMRASLRWLFLTV